MNFLSDLKIKVFADGADQKRILDAASIPWIKGFTTNPTLMRAAGVANYEAFARDVLEIVKDRPISFEVFADELPEMERQARKIAAWGDNVYVKLPITNTSGVSVTPLAARLSKEGIKINITAILTTAQIRDAVSAVSNGAPSIISIFAGRIADTGRDPLPVMCEALSLVRHQPGIEILWASPREVLNLFQANDLGCHIITMTESLLSKLANVGRDLDEYSLETVKMFYTDAVSSAYEL